MREGFKEEPVVIWTTSRRSAGMMEVVDCGVCDSPLEGYESLWDVFVCCHPNIKIMVVRKRRKTI